MPIRHVMAVALAAAFTATLHATVSLPTEFHDLVARAGLIVFGHVTDVRSYLAADGSIESAATVAVDDALKGDATPFISVHVPGGTVGRVRMVMVDAPRFDVGERAVLFLERQPDGWHPVGLSMGVCRVYVDARTGATSLEPPLVVGVNAAVGPVVRGDPRRKLISLKEFTSLVRLVIAGQALAGATVPR